MTNLTATQTLILDRASKQEDRIALPLPDRLRGGAANKVIVPLIKRGFLDEVEADIRNGEPVWRKTGDGHGNTLVITEAGLEVIGFQKNQNPIKKEPSEHHIAEAGKKDPREGTKLAALVAMLRTPDGATLDAITEALGWQRHTARGAMTNLQKRYPALTVTSEIVEGRIRTYRIIS